MGKELIAYYSRRGQSLVGGELRGTASADPAALNERRREERALRTALLLNLSRAVDTGLKSRVNWSKGR